MQYFKILNCTKEPFPENPQEGLFAPIGSHKNGLESLISSTDKSQNVVNAVIGEASTGKTTLLYEFKRTLLAKAPDTLISCPPRSWFVSGHVFIQKIAEFLTIDFAAGRTVDELQARLKDALIPTNQSISKKHILCIDQAEKLPFHFLEVLDSLYENQISGRLQIFLFGTNRFEDKLSQYQTLLQKTNFVRLPAKLSCAEIKELATYHLRKAGSNHTVSSLLTPAGCYYAYLLSSGNPGKALQFIHLVILNLVTENRSKAGILLCHQAAKDIFPDRADKFALSHNLAVASIAVLFLATLLTTADLNTISTISKNENRPEKLQVEQTAELAVQEKTLPKAAPEQAAVAKSVAMLPQKELEIEVNQKVEMAVVAEPETAIAKIEQTNQPTTPVQADQNFDQVASLITRLEPDVSPKEFPQKTKEQEIAKVADNSLTELEAGKTEATMAPTTEKETRTPTIEAIIAEAAKTNAPAQTIKSPDNQTAEALQAEKKRATEAQSTSLQPIAPQPLPLPAVKVLNASSQKTAVKKITLSSASPKPDSIAALKTKKKMVPKELESQFIGTLAISKDSTLGHMIRAVYGRNSVTINNIKWLIKNNPHIKDPDNIQPGTIINFPPKAVKIPKGAKAAWWIKTGSFKTLKEAYSFLRQNTPAKPWLLILSATKGSDADFTVVVEQYFDNQKSAEQYMQTLFSRGLKNLSVLSGLDDSKYFFKEKE